MLSPLPLFPASPLLHAWLDSLPLPLLLAPVLPHVFPLYCPLVPLSVIPYIPCSSLSFFPPWLLSCFLLVPQGSRPCLQVYSHPATHTEVTWSWAGSTGRAEPPPALSASEWECRTSSTGSWPPGCLPGPCMLRQS